MISHGRFLLSFIVFPLIAFGAKDLAPVSLRGSERLSFEPNGGQTAEEVRFVAHGKRSSLFLTPGRLVLSLERGERQLVLEMRFVGANPNPRVEGQEKLAGTVNYFLGADRARWRTGLSRFGRVQYRNLYPGIDLVYYGNDRQLDDFVVSRGADPRAIRLRFAGQDRARIDRDGDLVLVAAGYELRQHKPVIYQQRNGRREPVGGRYVLRGDTVGFEVARYDADRELVIDPLLGYSSYLGGNNEDNGSGVATDSACNVYVTGGVLSSGARRERERFM